MVEYVNLLDKLTEDRELPEGYDFWAIRSVRPDFRSRNDYRWPFPGNVAKAAGPPDVGNTHGCPTRDGDGICAATDWRSMASGGIPALTLLLVAVRTADVLGRERGKFRASEMRVVDLVDGARLVKERGKGANMSRADLSGANLSRADLSGANLYGANLSGANLSRANLSGADLSGADLSGANLSRADLSGANLSRANLSRADLYGDNLSGANLSGANLSGAYLSGADLSGAYLSGANLYGANLSGANLSGAYLSGANLYGANLSGANLSGADLSRAYNVTLPAGWAIRGGLVVRDLA